MVVAATRRLTLKRAMSIGTAGLTAMFCVMVLKEHGVRADKGEVLVTVQRAASAAWRCCYWPSSVQRRGIDREDGCARISEISWRGKRRSPTFAGRGKAARIGTMGGCDRFRRRRNISAILRQMNREGCVAAVGLAGGAELHTTVYPFT